MTYDPKVVEAVLAAYDKAALSGLSGSLSNIKALTDAVNALRPPKKYYTMPTFEEAAKLAGVEIKKLSDGNSYFETGKEDYPYVWRWSYNYLCDLTALDKPPGKIPAGKDCRIEDLDELISVVRDQDARVDLGPSDMWVLIDAIKEKYGV